MSTIKWQLEEVLNGGQLDQFVQELDEAAPLIQEICEKLGNSLIPALAPLVSLATKVTKAAFQADPQVRDLIELNIAKELAVSMVQGVGDSNVNSLAVTNHALHVARRLVWECLVKEE